MIRLRLLGSVELQDADGREIRQGLVQPKRLALLAYLAAARPMRFHRRDSLLAMFWPDLDESRARDALKQAVSYLRHALGPKGDAIIVNRGADELGVEPSALWCDAAVFIEHVAAGRSEDALALYRGDLMEGFFAEGSTGFQDWLDRERTHLRGCAADAAHRLASQHEATQDLTAAVVLARQAVALSEADELLIRHLLALLDRTGDRAGAVHAYEQFAQRLADEYEAEPAAETRALIEQIRRRSDVAVQRVTSPVDMVPSSATTSSSPDLSPGRRRRSVVLLAGLLVVTLAFGFAVRRGRAAPTDTSTVIAVMPPEVLGAHAAFDVSRYAELVHVISYNLDNASGVRAANASAVLNIVNRRGGPTSVRDPDVARAVAREAGAGYYIQSTILDRGPRIRILATLHPLVSRGTDTAVRVDAEGDVARLDALLTRITGLLLAAHEPGRVARFGNLAARTTDSLSALYAYLDGERLFRERRLDSAMTAFRRAVAIDTAFALAYYRLAVVASWGGTPGDTSARGAAVRHEMRLPGRYRQLIRAFDAYMGRRAAEAESLYRAITKQYPDDQEAWFYLGDVLLHYRVPWGGSIEDARSAFHRALGQDSADAGVLGHLAWLAAMESRYDTVAAIAGRATTRELGEYNALAGTALVFHHGRVEDQAAVLLRLQRHASPDFLWMATGWAGYVGALEGAIQIAELLTTRGRDTLDRARGYLVITDAELGRGRRFAAAEARRQAGWAAPSKDMTSRLLYALSPAVLDFSSARELHILRDSVARASRRTSDDSLRASYLVGLLSARLQDSVVALRHARQLEHHATVVLTTDARRGAMAHDLALTVYATLAWRAGRPDEALSLLERRHPERWWVNVPRLDALMAQSYERWMRAEVLAALGRTEEAIDWYLPMGMWIPGNEISFLAPSRLRLGEIYERTGRYGPAVRHYQHFIRLWSQADPDLQQHVIAAQQRVAKIAPEGTLRIKRKHPNPFVVRSSSIRPTRRPVW